MAFRETKTIPYGSPVQAAPIRFIEIPGLDAFAPKNPKTLAKHRFIRVEGISNHGELAGRFVRVSQCLGVGQRRNAYLSPSPFRHICLGGNQCIEETLDIPGMHDVVIITKRYVFAGDCIEPSILSGSDTTVPPVQHLDATIRSGILVTDRTRRVRGTIIYKNDLKMPIRLADNRI
jgi:hypothetical protein